MLLPLPLLPPTAAVLRLLLLLGQGLLVSYGDGRLGLVHGAWGCDKGKVM